MGDDEPTEIRISRKKLGEPLDLPTDRRYRVVILSPKAAVLDVEDEHFNTDRSVLLPDLTDSDESPPSLDQRPLTGLGVLYAALVHAEGHPSQGLFVTGHTDPSGSAASNQSLSVARAENISLLLRGKRDDWAKQCAKHDAVDDCHTILNWQHQRAGWDCDPGPINNVMNARTKTALRKFQEMFNAEVDRVQAAGEDSPLQKKIAVDGVVGKETWGAFYDLYMVELMELLELTGYAPLQQRQARLKPPSGMTDFVGCGEHVPFDAALRKPFVKGRDERLDGPPRNPADRRVELLFIEPGDEVKLVCHPKPEQCQPAACPVYVKFPFKFAPIGIPKGLKIAEINLRLVFVDPEGKTRPFPAGLPVLAKFGEVEDPPGEAEPEAVGDEPAPSKAPILDDPEPAPAAKTESEAPPEAIVDLDEPEAPPLERPTATVGDNGLLRFAVPRKATTMYLRFLAGEERCYVTADPKNLDDQKLVTRDEALAAFNEGRVFFQLPPTFDTQDGYWKAPAGVKFDDGKFQDMNNLKTQIGSREKPADLTLEVKWQFFRFEFFDRWTSSPTCVPQPRSKDAHGKPLTAPLVLEGFGRLASPIVQPKLAEARSAWDLTVGKDTVHCLGWARREIDRAASKRRELPDETALVLFHNEKPLYVRTGGDGKSPDAKRDFACFAAADAAVTTAGAERLRLYDLPDDWWSLNYPARMGGEAMEKAQPFEKVVKTASTKDKPYVVSLDTVVLQNQAGDGPEAMVWDDSKIERRFSIYDHELAVHRPDPDESYFTKLGGLKPPPAGPVLCDLPPFTRLIAVGHVLYSVFDKRTPRSEKFSDAPIGARWATRLRPGVADAFSEVTAPYAAPEPDGSTGLSSSFSAGITGVLRCSGHEGTVEKFQLFQFYSVFFDFAPTPTPNGPTPITPPVGPAQARTRARDCLLNVAKRWNGGTGDSLNPHPAVVVVGQPAIARGRCTLLIPRGAKSAAASPEPGEVRVDVFHSGRANMGGDQGTWSEDSLVIGNDGWFTAAHEIGHSRSLPDEYLNGDYQPALNQPHITEQGRVPGTIYGLDPLSIMVQNRRPRARHFWHLVLWAVDRKHFADAKQIVLERGPIKFTTDITPRDRNPVLFPRDSWSNRSAGGLSLCDQFVYVTGHDEWTAGDLGGSSLSQPFDGVIAVRVKIQFSFLERSGFEVMRRMIERAGEAITTAFNRKRRLIVNGVFDGKPGRFRVLFCPRFLCATAPSDSEGAEYMAKDINYPKLVPPLAAAYQARVATVAAAYGLHAAIDVVDGRRNGLVSGTPRTGNVRDGALMHFFESSDFDEDVLLIFSQLIGLPKPTGITALHFLPLLGILAPRLVHPVPELRE